MCSAMFCGMPSAGRGMLGLVSVGPPALQLAAPAGAVDALLDFADGVEILVELALIGRADLAAEVVGVGEDGIEHALVALACLVPEKLIEGQRRIELQRRRRGRRGPGDVRAVEHRIVFVDRRIGRLRRPAPGSAPWFGAVALGDDLIDAGARADFAAGGEQGAGEQIAGLRAVDVALLRLGVVQAVDEEHLLAEVGERREHLAQLHLPALAACPPFAAVKAVAGEQDAETHGSRIRRGAGFVAPSAERFQPGQRHGDADAAQERTPGRKRLGMSDSRSSSRTFVAES